MLQKPKDHLGLSVDVDSGAAFNHTVLFNSGVATTYANG